MLIYNKYWGKFLGDEGIIGLYPKWYSAPQLKPRDEQIDRQAEREVLFL